MRRLVKAVLLVLVTALVLPPFTALACYSPADPYAVEVVLNKPGVKYYISKLADLGVATRVEYFGAYTAYAYRSHYDSRLIVVVSVQGLKHANVRAPTSEPTVVVSVSGLSVDPKRVIENAEKAGGELGWSVKTQPVPGGRGVGLIFTKTVGSAEVKVSIGILEPAGGGKGYTVKLGLLVGGVEEVSDELASRIKLEVENLLDRVGLPQLKKLLKLSTIKNSLPGKPPEQERYIAVRIQIPLRQEVVVTTVYTCSTSAKINASKLKFGEAEKARVERVGEESSGG